MCDDFLIFIAEYTNQYIESIRSLFQETKTTLLNSRHLLVIYSYLWHTETIEGLWESGGDEIEKICLAINQKHFKFYHSLWTI